MPSSGTDRRGHFYAPNRSLGWPIGRATDNTLSASSETHGSPLPNGVARYFAVGSTLGLARGIKNFAIADNLPCALFANCPDPNYNGGWISKPGCQTCRFSQGRETMCTHLIAWHGIPDSHVCRTSFC